MSRDGQGPSCYPAALLLGLLPKKSGVATLQLLPCSLLAGHQKSGVVRMQLLPCSLLTRSAAKKSGSIDCSCYPNLQFDLENALAACNGTTSTPLKLVVMLAAHYNSTQQWHHPSSPKLPQRHHVHSLKVGRHPLPNHTTLQWHPTMFRAAHAIFRSLWLKLHQTEGMTWSWMLESKVDLALRVVGQECLTIPLLTPNAPS